MLQIFLDVESIAQYFLLGLLLPLLVFICLILLLWYFQSKLVLHIYYRIVLPELRKNVLLYWLIGGAAVASHELLGHALIGAVTGSETALNAAITPEKSEVKISHRPSAWGYLSAILATLAPCFAPPLAILLAFALLFPGTLTLSSYDPVSAFSALAQNFIAVAGAIFNSDLTDPANALFIYLLVALSLTSGASKTDFRIVLDATRRFWYFAVFLVLIFASALELVRFLLQLPDAALLFYPFASLLVLSSLTVLAGLLLALVLAAFLRNMGEFGILRKLASFLAFPFAYVVLIYSTLQLPYPYFSTFLLSVLFAFLAQFALKLLNPYLQKKGPAPANHTRLRRR